jgi:DNA-binding XRE family transcriptional regulator
MLRKGEVRTLAQWRKTTVRRPSPRNKKPVEPVYVKIGAIICEMRERQGVSQKEVADHLGWTRAAISNLEKGRQRVMLHDLPRIAKVLRIPIRDLLDPKWTGPGRKNHERKRLHLLGNSRSSRRR